MDKKIPDRRATEKTMSDIVRLLKSKTFNSTKEMDKYMKEIIENGEIPMTSHNSDLEAAEDIMYDAWDTDNKRERVKLANKALSTCPDCADAYVLLAEETARNLEEVKKLYQKGVEAGERALGEDTFKEYIGHFWGEIETRPYMRARAGLAESLWQLGQYDEAIGHYREMLRLNPHDNQGIRYILASCLAELRRYDDLEQHLNSREYKDDCAPDWCYTKALVTFAKNGASKEANRQLATAMEYNPYVPEYLTGKKRIPEILSDMVSMGGEDEAYCYAHGILSAWKKVPGAIAWLKEQTGLTRDDGLGDTKQARPKVGRNDPCPCGSGKKYKQCCGR